MLSASIDTCALHVLLLRFAERRNLPFSTKKAGTRDLFSFQNI
jgi:hypothetical protein